MSLLPEPEPVNLPPQASMPAMKPPGPIKPPWDFAWVRKAGEIAFLTGTLGLVMGALFRFLQDLLRWFKKRWGLDDYGVVESLETGFFEDLLAVYKVIVGYLKEIWWGLAKRFGRAEKAGWQSLAVRRFYGRLLKWSALKGYPRLRGQTPLEYLKYLSPFLPEGSRRDFETLTETYVRIRYGPPSLRSTDVDLVRSCWRRIKSGGLKKRPAESRAAAES